MMENKNETRVRTNKEKCKLYYERNKESIRAKQKAWYYANHEKVKASKNESARKNPHKRNARIKTDRAYSLYVSCRSRARKRGIVFTLSENDITIPQVCPVLGIRINLDCSTDRDYWPSVDRIDPSKGYTKDNICVISWRANRLKADSSLEEMERILLWRKQQ